MAAPRLGFAGRRVRNTANPAGFIAPPDTNAAYAAHEFSRMESQSPLLYIRSIRVLAGGESPQG